MFELENCWLTGSTTLSLSLSLNNIEAFDAEPSLIYSILRVDKAQLYLLSNHPK